MTKEEMQGARDWAMRQLGYLPPDWDTDDAPSMRRWLDTTSDGRRVKERAMTIASTKSISPASPP